MEMIIRMMMVVIMVMMIRTPYECGGIFEEDGGGIGD